jgi:polyisoprenoid-binding protein YceI
MATDTQAVNATEVPPGAWTVDPVHSSASFSVTHMMVGTFRGEFADIDASLTDGKLVGKVKVPSLVIKQENLKGHLLSPDFFDAEKFPEIVFESSALTIDGDTLTAEGTLKIKDKTVPVVATGRIAGPVVTLGDVEKIGIDLETAVETKAVGLSYNATLPKGGVVLGNTVTITVTLELALADED